MQPILMQLPARIGAAHAGGVTRARWLLSAVALLLLWDATADTRRAYPSPEMHERVHRIEIAGASPANRLEPARLTHDFDGDGIPDELRVEYFHMEPLFRRSTSGMLLVRSGADASVLLAHALDTSMNAVSWCGDVDGNGTDDLLVEDEHERFVLGYVK